MKRKSYHYALIVFSLMFVNFFMGNTTYAGVGECKNAGGTCQGSMCDKDWYQVYDNNGLPIWCVQSGPTVGSGEACCYQPDNQCESFGYECYISNPNPDKYEKVSDLTCIPEDYYCYKLKSLLDCNYPGKCYEATKCPDGFHLIGGNCEVPFGQPSQICCAKNVPGACNLPNKCLLVSECNARGGTAVDGDCRGSLKGPTTCCAGASNFSDPVLDDPEYTGPRITNLVSLLTPIAKILYYGALLMGLGFIIYSGYVLMTSEGSPDRVQKGKEQLTAAIAGIIFILLSAAILRVIINLLHV